TTAIQAAVTAAASGGHVFFPPGTFKVTTQISATIASGASINITGSGQGVSKIKCTGCNGFSLTTTNNSSTVNMADLSIITTDNGDFIAIFIQGAVVSAGGAFNTSTFRNIAIHGADYFTTNANYWTYGMLFQAFNFVILNNITINGSTTSQGNGVSFNGDTPHSEYAIVLTIDACIFDLLSTCVLLGSFWQGVMISNTNMTNCINGVFLPGSQSGALVEISIVNSQMQCSSTCVYIGTTMQDLNISNCLFLTANGIAANLIYLNAPVQGVTIVGNSLYGENGGLPIGIGIPTSTGVIDGVISGNIFGYLSNAIYILAAAHQLTISDNIFFLGTTNYFVQPTATGVVIDDHNLNTIASLPGVSAALNGSKFIITDGAAPTYHGAVGAAGAVVTPVFVSGGVYVYD
ncbi:MAG: hypothetical protein ACREBQ_07630, partial [Nitrososphaerales archaeon]